MNNLSTSHAASSSILHNLFVVCKHLSLYHEENTVVRNATLKLMGQLGNYCQREGDLLISVAKYNFLIHGEPLNPKDQLFSKFAYRMFQHGMSSFSISATLTIPELYSFLRLLVSKPADTWDKGGICSCLAQRGVTAIQVKEMSKRDFLLLEHAEDSHYLDNVQSSKEFWNKFARKLLCSISDTAMDHFDPDRTSAAELAQKITELLREDSHPVRTQHQNTLTKVFNHSLLAAQGQKIAHEKVATFLKLADFVNHLGEEQRQEIITGICNLQLLRKNAEDFLNGFSDASILTAFKLVTQDKNYSSPVILPLITQLAREKKLISDNESRQLQAETEKRIAQMQELLRADKFNQYVPQRYQKTLLEILSSQKIPQSLNVQLEQLKKQLETAKTEQQMAKLSLHILQTSPDQEYLPALHKQMALALEHYLGTSDYAGLLYLCRSFCKNRPQTELNSLIELLPATFYSQVLKDVSRLGKEYHSSIDEIITLLGPGFIRPLLELMTIEQNRAARLLFLKTLKKIGETENVIDAANEYLEDHRWFVVRNILLLLGQLGATNKLPQIRTFLNHNHQRVRQEALKTCLRLKDKGSLSQLSYSLSSADRQEVLHAISMCSFVNAPELVHKMLVMLAREKLFTFDFDIKKALVHSLAKQQQNQALPVFAKKLKARKILHARRYQQLKLEIIRALMNYPADQALPLLKQQINTGSGATTVQAKQVLNKLLEGKPE